MKMNDFLAFLKHSKQFLKSIPVEPQTFHVIIGNESCDLDSTVSSLLLGYYMFKQNHGTTVIPIINVSREHFSLRGENCCVLNNAGISFDNLVFRDEVNFKDLISKNSITASLVDHHVLSKNDAALANHVRQIFDHRPKDPNHKWDELKVKIRLEQVGSCCTLIADEIWKYDIDILDKSLAYMLYQTIIYDTLALKPEKGKAKPLDIDVGRKLEEKFHFSEDRQALFDRLWAAHIDVSHLSATQLLYKDMKVVEGVYIPGLPMLVEDYLKKDGAYEAVVGFATKHGVTCVLLVGLDASSDCVRRDVAIYSKTPEDKLRTVLLKVFKTNREYDFQFEKRATQFGETVELLHVHNTKLSRKQLIPLVNEAWMTLNSDIKCS